MRVMIYLSGQDMNLGKKLLLKDGLELTRCLRVFLCVTIGLKHGYGSISEKLILICKVHGRHLWLIIGLKAGCVLNLRFHGFKTLERLGLLQG